MFPIAVGLYPGLFEQRRRGMLAGVLLWSYNLAVMVQGQAGRYYLDRGWKILLWVGLVPVVLAPLAFLFVPDDRKIIPWGGASKGANGAKDAFHLAFISPRNAHSASRVGREQHQHWHLKRESR